MSHVMNNLPRQPIPHLDETLNACMRSVSPVLNSLQRLKSKLVFELYGAAQTKQQQRLLALSRQHPINWCAAGLTRLWLSCRGGLPYTNNYVLLLEDDPNANSITERAARLTVAALHLYQRIRAQALSPDVAANLPLEMDQYRRCYATHRRPHLHCDELITVNGSSHIAVLIDGDVHCMAFDLQRAPSVRAVQQAYDHILEHREASQNDMAPGMLTALPREQWARRRSELQKNNQNEQTLSLLEKALFVVCLDTVTAPGSMSGLTANLRDGNSHNRYYDKSMQIVVMSNGKAGLCFERAAVDGSVALGYAARLHHVSLRLSTIQGTSPTPSLIRTRAATWAETSSFKQRMQAAKKFINEARSQRSIETWITAHLGVRECKILDISPDAVAQLAIQCATSELLGEMPTIFEPVQTRHFAGGRMDFIVPTTSESLSAVRALRDTNINPYSTAAYLRRAAKAHQQLIMNARGGRGLITHLLALNAAQAEDAGPKSAEINPWRHRVLPHLDKGIKTLLHQDVLAANGSGHIGVASFSPIGPRPHMLSIGYIIKENDITFDLRADGRFSARTRALRTALDRALAGMQKVLSASRQGECR